MKYTIEFSQIGRRRSITLDTSFGLHLALEPVKQQSFRPTSYRPQIRPHSATKKNVVVQLSSCCGAIYDTVKRIPETQVCHICRKEKKNSSPQEFQVIDNYEETLSIFEEIMEEYTSNLFLATLISSDLIEHIANIFEKFDENVKINEVIEIERKNLEKNDME